MFGGAERRRYWILVQRLGDEGPAFRRGLDDRVPDADPVVHRVAIRVPFASKMFVVVVVVNVLASLLSSMSTAPV